MKSWLIPLVLVGVCVAGYMVARHRERVAPSQSGSAPGQLAPEFSLEDMTGGNVKLSNYRGKVVLLNFWATWCEPCRHEIPEFVQLQNNTRGLQILGVSLDDSADPVHTFYRDFKMNYPVVIGDATLAQRYGGVLGLPITFLIGCDGRVSARHIGEVQIPKIKDEINSLLKSEACTER